MHWYLKRKPINSRRKKYDSTALVIAVIAILLISVALGSTGGCHKVIGWLGEMIDSDTTFTEQMLNESISQDDRERNIKNLLGGGK